MLVHRCRILSHRPAAVSATQLCHATPTGTSDVAEHGGAQRFQIGRSENSGTGSAAPSEVGVPHVGRIARPTRQLTCFSQIKGPRPTQRTGKKLNYDRVGRSGSSERRLAPV